MASLDKIVKFVLPKKKSRAGGTTQTATFNPSGVVTIPTYRDHLANISTLRLSQNTQQLLAYLFKYDPDVSAALHAFMTISNTEWVAFAKDSEGKISPEGQEILNSVIHAMTRTWDYSLGFQLKRAMNDILDELKYATLLRGAHSAELVLDKTFTPQEIRVIDPARIEWLEKQSGVYKPIQKTSQGDEISLDIPTFFHRFYRRNPNDMFSDSMFVSCITTIISRIQIMNDLYAIMQVTGYPRLTLELMEEIAIKNAPADIKKDGNRLKEWLNGILSQEANRFSTVNPQQVYAHTDSVKPYMLNDKNAGVTLNIQELIDTLNSQNQAALKVVPTVIGRGDSGVNTASVEARLFSLAADSLNKCVSATMSEILTLAVRMQGFDGYVDFWMPSIELRPELELEPQKMMRQARLLEELSLGLITDEEYHLKMHRRLPAQGVQVLSGTNFQSKKVDTADVSSNSDPLGRSLAPEDSDSAKSNAVDNN